MIQRLDHTQISVAENIRRVFRVSYVVEARLIGASFFPPLHRTLEEFTDATTQFFGYWESEQLAAVMEIKSNSKNTLIQSLVVDPVFFRRGIGGKLVQFALDTFNSEVFNVETGADNRPAIGLYEKFGFRKIKEYVTDQGIRKVRLEKQR